MPEYQAFRKHRRWLLAAITLLAASALALSACSKKPAAEPVEEPTPEPQEEAASEEESEAAPDTSAEDTVPTALPVNPDDISSLAPQADVTRPADEPAVPARIQIERIGIDAVVVWVEIGENGYITLPQVAAGYWGRSAMLGETGNTVIVGHNKTTPQAIFSALPQVQIGDEVIVTDQFGVEYVFSVAQTEVIQVAGLPADAPDPTESYLGASADDRLTLLTCYPAPNECPDRFVAVAVPSDG